MSNLLYDEPEGGNEDLRQKEGRRIGQNEASGSYNAQAYPRESVGRDTAENRLNPQMPWSPQSSVAEETFKP